MVYGKDGKEILGRLEGGGGVMCEKCGDDWGV